MFPTVPPSTGLATDKRLRPCTLDSTTGILNRKTPKTNKVHSVQRDLSSCMGDTYTNHNGNS